MDIALWELWHTGILQLAFSPESSLFYIAWSAVLNGALIQWMLLKKAKEKETKWFFAAVLLFGLFVGEISYRSIIGWEQLVPLLGYLLCLFLLSGAGLSCLFYLILKKHWQ